MIYLNFPIRQDDVQNVTYHGCHDITASPTADSINGSTFILKCNFQCCDVALFICLTLYITNIGSHFEQLHY